MSARLTDDGYDPTTDQTEIELPVGISDQAKPDNTVFEIEETDDNFKPLTGPGSAPQHEIRGEPGDAADQAAIRERQTKAQRRASQRAARDRQEQELQTYRDENAKLRSDFEALQKQVTPRLDQIDQSRHTDQINSLDREIATVAASVENAISRMSEAMANGDASAHAAALRDHTRNVTRGFELTGQRQQLEHTHTARAAPADFDTRQQRQPQPAPRQDQPAPRMDPAVERRVTDFSSRHPWMNLSRPDRYTRLALEIDREVAAEGFDPRNDDYWDEMEDRFADDQVLSQLGTKAAPQPRRQQPAARQQQIPSERRGPMVAGSDGGTAASGARKVLLSPERKLALIQIGALDQDGRTIADPKKFQSMAKRYDEYDRAQGVAR